MKYWVAGSRGMVGSAIAARLREFGGDVVDVPRLDVDLRDPTAATAWARGAKPDALVLCAALVGGIEDNRKRPAEYARDNLLIHVNAVYAAVCAGASRIVVVGSSCMYPRQCPQPMREDMLWSGPLEPTNVAYAAAKLAAVETALAYGRQHGVDVLVPVAPNLYGFGDRYDRERGHFLAGMVQAFCDAVDVTGEPPTLWGDGTPRREAMPTWAFARGVVDLMNAAPNAGVVNLGLERDLEIREWANLVSVASGWEASRRAGEEASRSGEEIPTNWWDHDMPNGMPRKVMDCSKARALLLGMKAWPPQVDDATEIQAACREYRRQREGSKV